MKEESIELEILAISAADYTLLVKGLPEDYKKEELEQHIYNNFCSTEKIQIVDIISTYNIHDFMDCVKKKRM